MYMIDKSLDRQIEWWTKEINEAERFNDAHMRDHTKEGRCPEWPL